MPDLDLNAKDGSVRKRRYASPVPEVIMPEEEPEPETHELDSPTAVNTHRRLLDLYVSETDKQHDNRIERATDEDFYDNIQWSEDDAAILRERGQVPLVYNVLSSSVNWVLGTEKNSRTDFRILPRRKNEGKPAERKSQLLKYLDDVNLTTFHRSRAFADAVKSGLGWLEDGVSDDNDGEPIYSRYENWRNMIWDSSSTEMDLSDARYIFRTKWADMDIAASLFPERRDLLERSQAAGDSVGLIDAYGDEVMDQAEMETQFGGHATRSDRVQGFVRQRVRLIEAWYRRPEEVERITGGAFAGELFDEHSPGHIESVQNGTSTVQRKVTMRMHVAIFTQSGLLYTGPSPYRHNKFPFTPIWGNRRARDGMPYGMIRGLRDIQEDVNKRASKALYILSTNKIVMEEGAVDDIDELVEEASRPDGVIVKKHGKELTLNAERELSQAHLDVMSRSIAMLQSASGVTDELLGRRTNATSGVAIGKRQDQGSMTTSSYFDNLRYANQVQGEKQLSLVEQFVSEQKAFRITNMRGSPEYVEVNDGMPENDIVRSKADYIISDADWRASVRQAAAGELMATLKEFPPEIGVALLDLVVENLDLPNREEIVKRIRAVTGQRDPDAEELTPEEMERAKAQQQQQARNEAMLEAQIRKIMSEIARTDAQTLLAKSQAVKTNLQSLGGPKRGAIDTAADIMVAPEISDVADHIMGEAGFVGRTEATSNAEAAAAAQQAQEQRTAQAQQMAQAQQQQEANGGPPGIGLTPNPA